MASVKTHMSYKSTFGAKPCFFVCFHCLFNNFFWGGRVFIYDFYRSIVWDVFERCLACFFA